MTRSMFSCPPVFILSLLLGSLLTVNQPAPARDFSVGIELPTQVPVTPALESGLKELGIDYVNFYITTGPPKADDCTPEAVNNAMMDLCGRLGLDFSIATHHLDPPDDTIKAAATHPNFKGLVFDELEHIRLMQLHQMNACPPELALADVDSLTSLTQASDAALAGFTKLNEKFKALGSPANVSTHVWPALLHTAARAGFNPCPKICKEEFSSVTFAMGLGAALQYDRPLWADCDLWYYDLLPGHPPEELTSNLKLAYWMGAERIYIEGSGYNLFPQGRQGIPFSLMTQITPEMCQLTAHGEALRSFCRQYLPAHPRSWTWRDVKPDIALVRFDDSCHGQRFVGSDILFGSPHLHSDADTESPLKVWDMLTWGATGTDGLTNFKQRIGMASVDGRTMLPGVWDSWLSRPIESGLHRFFVPLSGTVVFDDTVSYERLAGIPVIFLAGARVTEPTMAAIHRRVAEGALCVAWGPLARRSGFTDWTGGIKEYPEGKGRFIVTDDFTDPAVRSPLQPWLGRPDQISYRFGDHRVTLRRQTPDTVTEEITEVK